MACSGASTDGRARRQPARPPLGRRPEWLKVKATTGPNFIRPQAHHALAVAPHRLRGGGCPNIYECWEEREATFLILGDRCTRRCGFCDVMTAKPFAVDEGEPARVADAVKCDGPALRRADRRRPRRPARRRRADLGGVRPRGSRGRPRMSVEVLPSDFAGGERDIATVIEAEPDVFAHNLETVRRLHGRIRPAFGYDRSLDVLRVAKRARAGQVTKSNLILGMGERPDEVREAMADLRDRVRHPDDRAVPAADRFHLPVDRWVTPDEFGGHARVGMEELGFAHVEAGPLVRSSYHAGKQLARAGDARASGPRRFRRQHARQRRAPRPAHGPWTRNRIRPDASATVVTGCRRCRRGRDRAVVDDRVAEVCGEVRHRVGQDLRPVARRCSARRRTGRPGPRSAARPQRRRLHPARRAVRVPERQHDDLPPVVGRGERSPVRVAPEIVGRRPEMRATSGDPPDP